MPCNGPAREPAASAESARVRERPLRISRQLDAEPLVIGDCRFDELARLELALAKQDRDVRDWTRKCIGHLSRPHGAIPRYPNILAYFDPGCRERVTVCYVNHPSAQRNAI